jgi:hypothetical protein
MAEPAISQLYGWNDRLARVVHYTIAWLMLLCLVAVVVEFGQVLLPGWRAEYLLGLHGLVALEAMASQRRLRGHGFYTSEWLGYRLAEGVTILVGIKLVLYAVHGWDRLAVDLPLWRVDFVTYFLTGEYLFNLFLAVVIWSLGTSFSEELSKLEGDERALQMERDTWITIQRAEARANLTKLIFMVGGVMVVATGFLHLDWRAVWGEAPPPLSSGALPILLYFLLALALLSLTQFAILRVRWSLERIPISRNLAVRWISYSAITLLLLAIAVSLLPTNYSYGLLEALSYILYMVGSLMSLIVLLVLSPIFWLMSQLARLLGQPVETPPEEATPPPPPPPPVGEGAPLWEMIQSILFWTIFLLIIGISLYHYLRQNQGLASYLRQLPWLGGLRRAWLGLRSWLRGAGEALAGGVQARLDLWRSRQGRAGRGKGWGFLNPRRLTPRERVIFFYLAMVRRGEEGGAVRHPSQTADEYSRQLHERLPEVSAEVDQLTGQFDEARYSLHPVDETRAGLVQQLWERIRKALRQKAE